MPTNGSLHRPQVYSILVVVSWQRGMSSNRNCKRMCEALTLRSLYIISSPPFFFVCWMNFKAHGKTGWIVCSIPSLDFVCWWEDRLWKTSLSLCRKIQMCKLHQCMSLPPFPYFSYTQFWIGFKCIFDTLNWYVFVCLFLFRPRKRASGLLQLLVALCTI